MELIDMSHAGVQRGNQKREQLVQGGADMSTIIDGR